MTKPVVRLAYADPPYLGCCGLYGHRHEAPYGCWDERGTWGDLLATLHDDYDGWAISLNSPSLYPILRICAYLKADIRVAAWVKPFAAFKRNVRIAYTWEPVIFKPGRDSSKDGAPVGRDHLRQPIQLKAGLTGAKPPEFCRWVLDLLGYVDGDTVEDMFPGTGIMGRTVAQGVLL
jgi:hypothetical protein